MKYLIVGLGNIGPEYALTRHNVGFMVLDRLAARENLTFSIDRLASVTELKHKGRSITLIKPTTYMNLSGKALQYWMTQNKITIENTLVIVDDLALPFGKLRLKPKGSSAGHNGLKNIESVLGNDIYPRLKFGIGSEFSRGRQIDYVLGQFQENDFAELVIKLDKAIEMILSFCTLGIAPTMNFMNE
jgi:peptidyl-tRNA hydrolase, PTH1 family